MNYLSVIRKNKSLTIKDAAKQSGISVSDWKKIERGFVIPTNTQIKKMSHVFSEINTDFFKNKSFKEKNIVGEGYIDRRKNSFYILEPKSFQNNNKKNVVDLFCGAGGLSHGFNDFNDFNVSLGLDLLDDRINTFHANNQNSFAICGDLKNFSLDKIIERVGKVDVLLGGPPCQGFSSIRPFRTLTENDSRNSLPENYLLAVSKFRPEWVIFENVVGILSTMKGNIFNQVLNGIKDLGYFVDYKILNAVELGVPQNRERVFIIARKNNKKFSWMKPKYYTNGKSMAKNNFPTLERFKNIDKLLKPLTVSDAISDLPNIEAGETCLDYVDLPKTEYQMFMRKKSNKLTLHTATKHSEKMMQIVKLSGKNRNCLPENLTTSGFSSTYSRLDYDQPSTTLTVNFIHPSSNRCIHPTQNRALTPREGARLQGFKDNFVFCGTRSNIVRQIGNAVPPIISKEIAKMIIKNS
jgi:DNA (cytosine-5)-methyltransferase 1